MGTLESFFYQHSGRSGLSIPLILVVGLPISAVFAILYAYVVVYCPIVGYVNLVFLVGYVVATGFALAYLARLGKCRNAKLLFGLGGLAGLVGLYFSWLFFFKAYHGSELPIDMLAALAANPSFLWEQICELNNNGWWGPSGIVQWILVAIEAIAFVFGVGILTSGSIDRQVFCETCDHWLKVSHTRHLQFTADLADKFAEMDEEDADFDHLAILRLPETTEESVPRFDAEVLECSTCGTSAVRLKLLTHQESEDGEFEVEETDLPGILLQPAKPNTP